MKVIVPVKRVPDTAGEKPLDPNDLTLDRDKVDSILCPMNEYAIEEACRLKEQHGAEVTVLLVGPESGQAVVRKALSYGLDAAVQVSDEAIHGSDAIATAKVIAAALRQEEFDVVIMGAQATDARTSIVPAAVAELLDVPSLTYARRLAIDGDRVVVHRETDEGWNVVQSTLPAVVSVVESINEPRYPSFKGIMAAKSKPLVTKSLADVGVDPSEVGLGNEWAKVLDAQPRPQKEAGKRVEDDGTGEVGAKALADWLVEHKII
ncbi:MAG: electron transfer flavoprotein subunit beta/FixA family protein [Actinomycetota bacterium]|nr:electron transfer flavoprotein subunit beta/FixA family protein [Actinomycetota bacterium]